MNTGFSSFKFGSYTQIGKDEEKKLAQIVNNLIDLPEATDFINPVPWQQLQLDDYLDIIKHPMHLYKVQEKLKARDFNTVQEVLDLIQLIWDNCKEYNKEGHYYELGEKMEKTFKKMIKNYLPSVSYSVQQKIANLPTYQTSKRSFNKDAQPFSSRIQQKVSSKMIQQKVHVQRQESKSQRHKQEEQIDVQEIPLSQKNRFNQRLKQITQQELLQIVFIIQQNCSEAFKHISGSRYQILVDNINNETFKKLSEKLQEFGENQKKINGVPNKKIKI